MSARTLGELFLELERHHARAAALQFRAAAAWREMPDWRFLRQVIRVALYLRERAAVRPGDRVALLSPLRPEAVVVQWATVVQGAVVTAIDPGLPDAALAAAIAEGGPRVAFVADASVLARIPDLPPIRVVLDGTAPEPARTWSEVLDLGGSLDTAERANAFRNECRAITPDRLATPEMTHGELIERARELRPPPGALAYVAAGGMHDPLRRLALFAFIGDGVTRTVLGSPGKEADEIAELSPQTIVSDRGLRTAAPATPREDLGERLRRAVRRIRRGG